MYKICNIKFIGHPVLGDLSLDFCDSEGNAVDTVIIAGENGAGKSTVMNSIYNLVSRNSNGELDFEADIEFEESGERFVMTYRKKTFNNGQVLLYANDSSGLNDWLASDDVANKHPTSGIYSDVDINFHAQKISSVTSAVLDEKNVSRRSSSDLPTRINQLIIDIQASDDASLARYAREHRDRTFADSSVEERMPRFTNAFNKMFDGLTYSRVENTDGQKAIVFVKNGVDIPIDALSSGEKQIVYRGCFMLRDANAMKGAFVFIDEPEISLHPLWQKRILDYYKTMFTDESGNQTSQIFVVTHSPFIIHNDRRKNDKVIILNRDQNGRIMTKANPEYFRCDSVEAVQDAFSITDFSTEVPVVYTEGRTDEMYLNKALETYGYRVPFSFKWIGHTSKNGKDVSTGSGSLGNISNFFVGQSSPVKRAFHFDSDTNREESIDGNVFVLALPKNENSKAIKKRN